MSVTMKTGLSFAAYQALPGLNWSTLKHAVTSPAHFAAAVRGELAGDDTADRGMLRACHAAVLEPKAFGRDFGTWAGRRQGSAYEAARAAAPHRHLLSVTEAAQVEAVRSAIHAHPVAGPLVRHDGGKGEVTLTWAEGGRRMKGRIDLLIMQDDRWIVADLKAVPSIAPRKLASEVARRLYHAQLAHYCAGLGAVCRTLGISPRPIEAMIIAYETRPMLDVSVVSLGVFGQGEAIFCGAAVRAEALRHVAHLDESTGPMWGQSPDLSELHLPAWAYGDDDPNEVTHE
jgi:hypothetical protein